MLVRGMIARRCATTGEAARQLSSPNAFPSGGAKQLSIMMDHRTFKTCACPSFSDFPSVNRDFTEDLAMRRPRSFRWPAAILLVMALWLTAVSVAAPQAPTAAASAPAVAAPGQAAPTPAPAVAQPKIDSGDTAWMLTSAALVLMM